MVCLWVLVSTTACKLGSGMPLQNALYPVRLRGRAQRACSHLTQRAPYQSALDDESTCNYVSTEPRACAHLQAAVNASWYEMNLTSPITPKLSYCPHQVPGVYHCTLVSALLSIYAA